MEFKGTPAPWFIEEYDINGKCDAKYFDIRSMSTDGYEYMDLLDSVRVGDEKALANAHLIAAAPELLDALIELTESAKEAIDGLGDLSDAIDTAKSAIAKALGQQ
ncbi:hypothetical protein ABN335_20800 [Providencia rettgeri]